MAICIDHVVVWVSDPLASVAFYERALGFTPLRVDEFREGKVMFPSVRIAGDTLLDLMPRTAAVAINGMPGAAGSAGNKLNHVCLAMTKPEYDALRARLEEMKVPVPLTMKTFFGARGFAPEAFYFADPDGNILEARYYDDGDAP